MKTIKIRKGWFWGAGHVYGWARNNYFNAFGVGIDMEILKTEPKIRIAVAGPHGGRYILECERALSFISTFHSVKTMRKKRIGVVSKTLLKATGQGV